ncbi:hypothetical protein PAXINDRAFT_156765 [Paxillus involutus ATCC 200175]|uniref:Uncharacterized protein n=1 Tax=Paxillus involutus ATCC 200175 TaxID=664439 RepID=A0A0C9TQN3_PAXIN|nr:hypothetical protein PAXINDRAFT_156765 [Paxillus involutus ATCC 200175]
MISSPSPTTSTSRAIVAKPLWSDNENENSASPPLSPKRSFAQDDVSQFDSKRRHVHAESQAPRRAPLDPLSASDLENRRNRDPRWVTSSTHRSLTTSSSVPDLRSFRLGQPVTSCGQQSSATTGTPTHSAAVCSWPPLTSASSAGSSSHSNHSGPHGLQGDSLLYSSDVKKPSRAASTGPTSTQWPPQGSTHLKSAPTMIKPTRTHGWKSENVLQPIKSRTSPIPYVRRPPGELWQSDSPVSSSSTSLEPRSGSESPRMVYRLVNDSNSLPYSAAPLTPPGLPPHRSELRRSSSDPNLLARVPISLSLASGSQPLRASEQAKSVVPIGAERSRVVSMTPLKSRLQHPKPMPAPTTDHNDPSRYLWYPPLLSPRLQAKWKGPVSSSEDKSFDNPVELGATKVSREDFERLLRQATKNKHASKIISPLSPLRTPAPALSLTSDSAYRSCMPSTFNKPSPRYFKGPEKRLRTLCDSYQPHDLDSTCVHCQECKRDTVGKRLLVSRYHEQHFHSTRTQLLPFPSYNTTNSLVRSDLGEVMMIEGDEDERSLWDEVAAVTSTAPLPFSRTGSSCAVAAATNLRSPPASPRLRDLRAFDDGGHDGSGDGYPEIPDEDVLTNESLTLFREVSAY